MKRNIRVFIEKEKDKSSIKELVEVSLGETNNVGQLIDTIKSKLDFLSKYEIVKDELYFGTQLMKVDESIPDESGIKLFIKIK